MKKRISLETLLVMLFVFAFSTAYAQEMEYKEYKVQQGDTLWDISSKEIQNPFLWPKIWKENPEIKNPDRINPGQIIKIPLRVLQKEPLEEIPIAEPVKPEQKEEPPKIVERMIKPVEKSYLADRDLVISSGYITDYVAPKIKNIGKITGSPSGRSLLGKEDFVYIKTNSSLNTSDRFYIVRSDILVEHPVTKKKLGHLIELIGIVETIGLENGETKAKIIKSYSEVRTGDLLDTYYDVEPVMEEDAPRKPDITGIVIATRLMKTINGNMDIIFIDKGSNNGLEIGDVLKTLSIEKSNKSRTTGVIQIISLKGSTATAIIRKSESVISIGDEAVSLK